MTRANEQLRARRMARESHVPGEPLGRAELAFEVNRYLWESTGVCYRLDAHSIARYERGDVRWPGAAYRSGLRAVLGVATDAELGFHPSRRGNTATQDDSPDHDTEIHAQDALMLRRLLDVYDLPEDGPTRSYAELEHSAATVIRWRLNADYTRVIASLPSLVPELTRAVLHSSEAARPATAALLMQVYRAADAVASKRGWSDLSARTIQIMQWAGEQSGDEVTRAVASYVRTQNFFRHEQFDLGCRMLEQAAERLTPQESLRAAAAYGALHMRAAVASARAGKPTSAWDHLTEAKDIAGRLSEGIHDGTAFGHASVRIHEVTLALDLHAPDVALAAAAGWVPPEHLPAERRSHYFVDIARAQLHLSRRDAALESLHTAVTVAPQHIRTHPQVISMLTELAAQEPESVRAFTTRTGIHPSIPNACGSHNPGSR